MVQLKEVKEKIDVDLTNLEHQVIYINSLAQALNLAVQGLFSKNKFGLKRMDLHAIAGLIEALKKEVDKLDEEFYLEVVEKAENLISDKLKKGA